MSLSVRAAKLAAGRPNMMRRGDPGILGTIGSLVGGVVSGIPGVGSVINTVGQVGGMIFGGGSPSQTRVPLPTSILKLAGAIGDKSAGGTTASRVVNALLPSAAPKLPVPGPGGGVATLPGEGYLAPNGGQGTAVIPAAGGGQVITDVNAAGCCPAGYHPNKSAYYRKTPGGSIVYHPKGSVCVRNRRRNPLNPRALSRSMSRVAGATKAIRKLISFETKVTPKGKLRFKRTKK